MFRISERLSSSGGTNSRRYVKRAVLFAAGLVLLWTALQLFPNAPAEPPVYSDDAGSVASADRPRSTNQGPRLFTLGNLAAFFLLAGGGAFAYYLHRRSAQPGGATQFIESMGELSIGQGQQLRLVRCGDDVILIGATAHEITLLREFDPAVFDTAADGRHANGIAHAAETRRPAELDPSSRKHRSAEIERSGSDRRPAPIAHEGALVHEGDHSLGTADPRHAAYHASAQASTPPRHTSSPAPGAASHFADVLRQYAGRYANSSTNGRTC